MPTQVQLLISVALLSHGVTTVSSALSDTEPWSPTAQLGFTLSAFHLRSLARCEPNIVQYLDKVRKGIEFNTANEWLSIQIQRYLDDYASSSGRVNGTVAETVEKIISHPLLAFRMVYRFVLDIAKFGEGMVGHDEFWELVDCEWPMDDDLGEAIEGILRLSFMFDLELDEFARGNIHGIETGFGLEPRHALAIGRYALEMEAEKYHALTVEWLELTKALLTNDAGSGGVDPAELDEMILLAVANHDADFVRFNDYANTFFTRKIVPRPEYPYEFEGFVGRYKQRTKDMELWGGKSGEKYREINYWGHCSGELQVTDELNSGLHCWYGKEGSWAINPLEIEELAKDPHLIQIYNVITSDAADRIIASAEPFMRPSLVRATKGDIERSKSRSSFSTWLPENEFPEAARIQSVVQLITGLKTEGSGSSEMLQVASYVSLGSHYGHHVDVETGSRDKRIHPDGDRIATFMIYLTDAEIGHGGQTVFVDAHVTARPVKGSAVFWYNLDTSGDIDYETYHGACPLVLGTKWVANKWIRYNAQFDVRKCPVEHTGKRGRKWTNNFLGRI